MKQIGYVAPNREMVKTAETIFKKFGDDVAIEIGSPDLGVRSAKSLIKNGAKVIIARGGAALLIRNNLNVPVIDIPVTFEDTAQAILEASALGNFIAIVGFENLLGGLELLNPLLKVNIEQVYINNKTEIEPEILKLKQKGFQVIIGGELQCRIAEKHSIKSVLLKSGPKAIYHAYQEAKTVLDTLMRERQRIEEIRAILDYSRDGYIAIDRNGIVTLANLVALKLISHYTTDPLGKPLPEVFPGLKNLIDVLSTGEEHLHDITSIGSTNILYNRIPIRIDKEVIGAVATFQDVTAVQEAESKIRNNILIKGWYANYTLADIHGESTVIKNTLEHARKFSTTDSTILITGESGVGKELFAQGIHNMSKRRNGPFVGVNCASLPAGILESELFGYMEGAFTGARKSGKPGLFEIAHRGTIFLDEINEIPLTLQGRLLRVLQEKKVMRLGSDKVIPIDTRIIAASNRNLALLVAQNKFREDLFFRINVLRLNIPPLRKRVEDIPTLITKFLNKMSANNHVIFSNAAIEIFCNYFWPGNIRELQNLIERLAIMADPSTMIDVEDINNLLKENEPLLKYTSNEILPLMKKEYISAEKILEALEITNGNKDKAANILGIHRSTLWRWLKKDKQ